MTPAHPTASTARPVFALPPERSVKADPARIAEDEARLTAIAAALERDLAEAEAHLEDALAHQRGDAAGRVEREARVDHFRRRRRRLQGVALDAVLGRMTPADGTGPVHVGRLAVHDADGRPLLVDWRSEAAAPFFAATRADPRSLASRRRYRWSGGRIRDYWDELLDDRAAAAIADRLSPDDDSALLSELAAARTPRMRSVLSTLAADQDAIIRARVRGPLVVDGGPGTGKTVVALHRAAYLLHTDPRLRPGRGGLLVLGPHRPYLHYVADVLPSLGEEDVLTATLADLVPEGERAVPEPDPRRRLLTGGTTLLDAIEAAVALHEQPPAAPYEVTTPWGPARIGERDWQDAVDAVDPGTPHNHARDAIWDELAEIVAAQLPAEDEETPDIEAVRPFLVHDEELVRIVHRAWPLLRPEELVASLFEQPALLRRCAPTLSPQDLEVLHRPGPQVWTEADLPLLDAARHRLGDPRAEARRRRADAARREVVEEVALTLGDLLETDDSEMRELSMLRGEDLRHALEDRVVVEVPPPDALAGPFAHVVVDEAQGLTDAQWAMVLRRCPSRSLTLVGDRAQAVDGFVGSWEERLARAGIGPVTRRELTLNYRTPREIMDEAAPVIRAVLPDAAVPTSIRSGGRPVRHGAREELEDVVAAWLAEHDEGIVGVITAEADPVPASSSPRVQVLSPRRAQGLEFDLVVLVDPERFGDGPAGAGARYVAMTRTTGELVVLDGR